MNCSSVVSTAFVAALNVAACAAAPSPDAGPARPTHLAQSMPSAQSTLAPQSTRAAARTSEATSGGAPPPTLIERALVFDLPAPMLAGVRRERLWATYYYVPRVAPLATGHTLRDMAGRSLGVKLSRRDWCEAAMQGTVVVDRADARSSTFNYAGTHRNTEVDCTPIYPGHAAIGRTRFTAAIGPFGDGVEGMVLIPFRTLAVDPDTIAFGSLIYVPAARGAVVTLPDGSVTEHDGYFFAADRGGAIKRTHIDVFVGIPNGSGEERNPFAFVTSKSTETFEAHVLAPEQAAGAHDRLAAAHRAFVGR